jgi:hypothetical protein
MSKLVDDIREALKPDPVEGFCAMCYPMPTHQQMAQLIAEVERLEAVPTGLSWSSDRPTESGYYWVRCDSENPEIVLVRGETPTCPKYALEHGRKDRYPLNRYVDRCEWCGPIPMPAEAAHP